MQVIEMYEFSLEEKQSMNKLVGTFVMMGRYQSDAILQRIEGGMLTKRDLESINKKLALAVQCLNGALPMCKDDFLTRFDIAKHAAVVDCALSRYRLIDWK